MFWGIWNICCIVVIVATFIYGYIRYKNAPTEKQGAKMEKSYNKRYKRTLTEADLNNFKKSNKNNTMSCVLSFIELVISVFL